VLISGLPFESSHGPITLPDYFRSHSQLKYVQDYDEYREATSMAFAHDVRVFNAGMVYDRELLQRYADLHGGYEVEVFRLRDLLEGFDELTAAEMEAVSRLLAVANETLREFRCSAECRRFSPAELPAVYFVDDAGKFQRTVERAKPDLNELWSDVLDSLAQSKTGDPLNRLVLNYNSPLVVKLSHVNDVELLRQVVRVLYLQTLLLGHHPLSKLERSVFSNGLKTLVDYTLSQSS